MTRKKILLVDDSETILMMQRLIFRRENYDLVYAHDGEEALEMVQSEHPDLVLLDIMMPRMNGFEVCKSLKENLETRNIPVIMVTTRGEGPNVATGFESGCNDYVTKPVQSLDLLNKVASCLHASA